MRRLSRARVGAVVATLCFLSGAALREAGGQTSEFRAFWADAFHEGFKSAAEIDSMVSRAVQGRYNVIIPEVMAYQDNRGNSHGAYWNSSIVPKAPDISGGIDPLGYLVQRAHAFGIEVHPWLVAYRVCSVWPPQGNGALMFHPEYFMVPQASMGTLTTVGGDYVLDPGCPAAQEYLVSIIRELVTNYAIDGVHWDYIRYTQSDAGYPSSTSYTNSGLARFRRITGYPGTPPPTGYAPWDDFRRRGVTELIRRLRAEIPSITGNPRQPVRHSAALITWGDAPSAFSSSSAWARFQNWEEWLRLGFLDTGIAMTYYDEAVYPTWYRNWVNREMTWRYQRQLVVGPAIYNNTFEDSITQMEYARSAGADGLCTYSYWATKDPSANDWTWYGYVASRLFTAAASVPTMTWRNPATATEGTLWGRVTDATTGLPVDDAGIQVGSMASVKTDGNGYYVVTMIPASGSGTSYTVTASKSGYTSLSHNGVLVVAGGVRRDDFAFAGGPPPPVITQQPQPVTTCPGATVQFSLTATGSEALFYQWQKNGANLSDDGHYAGVTTDTLTVSDTAGSDAAGYRCIVSNTGGSVASASATLSLVPTVITLQPQPCNVPAGETAAFTIAATGMGTLTYRWQKKGVDLDDGGHYAGTATASLTISAADENDVAAYRCVVTADCGSLTSNEVTLTLQGSGPEFIVESRAGGNNYAEYSEDGVIFNSTAKSGAAGTTAGIGSRWAYMDRATYGTSRAIYSFTPAVTGLYQMFVTWPSSSNASSNVEHIVTHAGGATSVF
ncbi:MAG: immunoglobulin domain-containing protein, partial [Phycisphaerae bacterium]